MYCYPMACFNGTIIGWEWTVRKVVWKHEEHGRGWKNIKLEKGNYEFSHAEWVTHSFSLTGCSITQTMQCRVRQFGISSLPVPLNAHSVTNTKLQQSQAGFIFSKLIIIFMAQEICYARVIMNAVSEYLRLRAGALYTSLLLSTSG